MKILDCDGHVLVKEEVMIAESNLLREDWFQERATNDNCYETLGPSDPWKGEDCRSNESPYFKDWVFVLLLASQRLRFLAENTSPRDLSKWIVRLSNELIHYDGVVPQNGTDTTGDVPGKSLVELRKELDAVCSRAIDRMQSWRRHNIGGASYLYHHDNPNFVEALKTVVRATLLLGNSNAVREAMIQCPTKLSLAL